MEDIKMECENRIALTDSMHDKLVPGFRSSHGVSLSQAEVWEMMTSVIEVSDCLRYIHEDVVEQMPPEQ